MRLSHIFKLVPATLIFLLSSCKSTPAPQIDPSDNTPLTLPSESFSPPTLPEENDESLHSDNKYWNVEQVDVSEIDPNRKLLSFTFDDSPSRTLESIFAVFAAFNEENPDCKASATVFFNGGLFDSQTPHLLYTACALGFELGNHTHSHFDLTTLTAETLVEEIDKTDALLEKADGQKRHLLRAPFGRTNELVREHAPTPLIDWTIDTLDWTGASEDEIYDAVFQGRFSGAIVLMHDGYEHTVSALKRLLPDLKADGYQVVSLSKMIKMHDCKFQRGNVYIRARKQN